MSENRKLEETKIEERMNSGGEQPHTFNTQSTSGKPSELDQHTADKK